MEVKEYGECLQALCISYEIFFRDVGYYSTHHKRHGPRLARYDWETGFVTT